MTLTLDPLPPPSHLPRLALEEAAIAAPPHEIATHLSGCASCQTYVQSLRNNAAQFLRAHPSERFLSQLASRHRNRSRPWLAPVGILTAIAAGAFALLALWPATSPGPRSPAQRALQFKGSLVSTYVQRQGEAVPLRAGDALHPKDAVRFVVRAEQSGFAAVLERDPDGHVTVIAPFGAARPQPVSPGSTALADSAILDSTLGRDQFVAVFSPEAFTLAPLVEALSAERSIDCQGCQVEVLEFDKHP